MKTTDQILMRNHLITEILGLVIRINEKRKHTVFLSLIGHVGGLEIRIHRNGWQSDKYYSKSLEIYCFTAQEHHHEITDEVISDLLNIRNEITQLLEDSYNEQHAVNS